MPPRPPKFSSRRPSSRHYGPSGAQLGAILVPTSHIWCPTSSKILTESRQTCQEEPEDPSRSRFSLILDPSRPRFSMILGTFCKYFKRCFCTLRPTSDLFFRRLWATIFIHLWYPSLHISHMFCTCFVRCFACLAPFRLIFSRIGWTSTWCCDGRLAKPAQYVYERESERIKQIGYTTIQLENLVMNHNE